MRWLYNRLRSRRLAVWLIGIVMAYAGLATLLPLGPPQNPAVAAWAAQHPALERVVGPLSLHQPFTSPLFIVVSIGLLLSTTACSIERTAQAFRLWRIGRVGHTEKAPLPVRPSFAIPCTGEASAVEIAVEATVACGLKPSRRDTRSVVASRGLISAFGSPLFHWALVGLFVFAALGQITRSEGDIAVVVGHSQIDARDAYLNGLQTGPFFAERFTGWEIAVTQVKDSVVADGVERGSSPYVRVTQAGKVLTEGLVYPNHPLTRGRVVVHRSVLGPAALVTITFPDGTTDKDHPVAFTQTGKTPDSAYSTLLVSQAIATTDTVVRIETAAGRRMVVSLPDDGFESAPVGVGESVRLPGGLSVRLDELTTFARLTVVNDWSVPFIYGAFILAVLGELFALLLPPRVVVTRYRPESCDTAVWVLRKKVDPAFPARVARAFGRDDTADKKERS